MSIILQALAKNQDRLIANNPTRIPTEAALAEKSVKKSKQGAALPDVSPIWEDAQTRAAEALHSAPAAPRGLSDIKISWVLIIVAMGCMLGLLAAFYPPSRVQARVAPEQASAAQPMLAEAPAAPERAVPQEAQPAQASEPAQNSDEATEPAAAQPAAPLHTLKPELVAAPSSPAQEAVVKVVFRKEGGQTEPDGTYRQEYAAAEGEDIRVASVQIYDPASTTDSDLLAVPGIVPVEATGAGNVPEVAYEDGTLYESAPIPTATRDADPADAGSSRFKTKGKHDNSTAGKPAAAKPAGPAPLRVEGIFWDRTRPMALINGDIVELGSRVRDGKVVDIQPSSVTIEIKGKQTVLTP